MKTRQPINPTPAATAYARQPALQPPASWVRLDWYLLGLVTLVAAGLRFYKLGVVPPGFQFDEAFNAIDAAQVLHGNFPLFLPANAGREVLYTYFQAAIGWFFGLNVYTLRLASALLGVAAVPLTYLWLRRLLQRQSRLVALFTSLTLAVSLWHIHFSHYGIRVISTPVLYTLLFGSYWVANRAATPARRIGAFAVAGLLTGLSVWTHPTGRFVPFVLLVYNLWLLWRHPTKRRLALDQPIGGLMLTGLVAFVVFLPLGLEFYRHPDWFVGHASEVSVFAQRVSGDAPWQLLLRNLLAVVGMFSWHGDVEWAHNLAGRPVFDPLLSLPFWLGAGLWGRRLWQRKADDPDLDALVLLALWLLTMLLPSILSEAAPNYSRTLPSLPATFVAAGLGLSWIVEQVRSFTRHKPAWLGPAVAGLMVTVSGSLAFYDYFVRFPRQSEVYYLYDADKLDVLNYLNQQAASYEVYLQPLWADHPPVRFLRRSALVKALDTADALVLPAVGKAALYAFPDERVEQAEQLATYWPSAQVETIPDRYGQLLLAEVKLSADQLADWPPQIQPTTRVTATFAEAPSLVGMSVAPAGDMLTLFWHASAGTARNLTAFVHLLNGAGQRVGQIDKLPANGSYETNVWSPGERVVDHYRPELTDPCAGGETVQVVVGWYEQAANGARRPRADAPGDTALAGQLTLPIVGYPAEQLSLPNSLNLSLLPHANLAAATAHAADWQAGAPLTVELYWQGDAAMSTENIKLHLANQAGNTTLWTGKIAPGAQWHEGEIICRRLHLRLPAELPPGAYALQVAAAGRPVTFADLTIGPSTRQFTVPTFAQPVEATFDQTLRLLGYSATPGDLPSTLDVNLVWQAQASPPASYTVFVHLLDAAGQIVAQSDALPNGGYTTDRWVAGEVVTDTHRLTLPAALPPGRYQLAAGLYDGVSGQRLAGVDRAGQALPAGAVIAGAVELP